MQFKWAAGPPPGEKKGSPTPSPCSGCPLTCTPQSRPPPQGLSPDFLDMGPVGPRIRRLFASVGSRGNLVTQGSGHTQSYPGSHAYTHTTKAPQHTLCTRVTPGSALPHSHTHSDTCMNYVCAHSCHQTHYSCSHIPTHTSAHTPPCSHVPSHRTTAGGTTCGSTWGAMSSRDPGPVQGRTWEGLGWVMGEGQPCTPGGPEGTLGWGVPGSSAVRVSQVCGECGEGLVHDQENDVPVKVGM